MHSFEHFPWPPQRPRPAAVRFAYSAVEQKLLVWLDKNFILPNGKSRVNMLTKKNLWDACMTLGIDITSEHELQFDVVASFMASTKKRIHEVDVDSENAEPILLDGEIEIIVPTLTSNKAINTLSKADRLVIASEVILDYIQTMQECADADAEGADESEMQEYDLPELAELHRLIREGILPILPTET